jgi:integrase
MWRSSNRSRQQSPRFRQRTACARNSCSRIEMDRRLNVRWQDDDPWRPALQRAGREYRRLYLLRHTYTFVMLSAGKPLQWIAAQLGHRGVAKIDETYGGWRDAHKLPARPLDLEELFRAIRNLPPFAAETRPNLPRICQEFLPDAADG